MISLLHFTHLSIAWCIVIAFLIFTFVCELREQTACDATVGLLLSGHQMLLSSIHKLNAEVNKEDTELSDQNISFIDARSPLKIFKLGRIRKTFQ